MKRKDRNVIKALSLITQIGISMLASVLLALLAGHYLDKWLHTGFFTVIFVILGILAAFRSAYKLTRSFYAEDLKREEEQIKYLEELKNYGREHPERKEDSDNGKEE